MPKPRFVPTVVALMIAAASLCPSGAVRAQVPVRHAEGVVHGFLVLRDTDGRALADGDLLQTSRGSLVTSRVVFRFKDGSRHDETAVFSERQQFRLVRDHLIQKGRSFPRPIDMTIDVARGQVTVRYSDDHGQPKVESEQMKLPPDLANGLVLTLLKNARPDALPGSVGFIAATPKPRLVKLALSTAGEESFSTGGTPRKATHYVLKVEIGAFRVWFSRPRRAEPLQARR